ncbi:DNA translocase FtsK 4TM domain-containing protein [Georgenia sp. SUBG003]|uniref:DNA translocase FtsK 4TM domain-containing protein n=1 Tax=Georgenia sp. SUBG003 TaxID=1497974 RepID=UPI003AB6791F
MGGTARSVGSGAKDLDPALRRDGLAFLLLGLAIVIALREWFGLSGIAGNVVHHVAAGVVGVLGVLLPLVLVGMAVRLMRHPERAQANARVSIGLTAVIAAVCGLIHIGLDLPSPGTDFAAVERAGGLLGWLLGTPLTILLSEWGAVPILVLAGLFGILVVTATPVAAVPARLRGAGSWLLGRQAEEADGGEASTEVVAADGGVRGRRDGVACLRPERRIESGSGSPPGNGAGAASGCRAGPPGRPTPGTARPGTGTRGPGRESRGRGPRTNRSRTWRRQVGAG